jgi:transposase
MAFHYADRNRDQLFLMPVSMRDWLDEGHLAWFVIDVVAHVDTSAFHARHANDGPGRPAYNPEMMLALLFYAYGVGERSSRRIESLCRTDAAFRVIGAGATPDHATIARFLVDHERAIEGAFLDVLRLCAAAGLVSVGNIAIDGTKMGTDAALDANRGRAAVAAELERLRAEIEKMLAEARATDAAEEDQQALFGLDRLPAELSTRGGRLARLEVALATIEAGDAAEAEEAAAGVAKAREEAEEGRKLKGRKPKGPHALLARAEVEAQVVATRVAAAQAERAAARVAREAKAQAEGRKPNGSAPKEMWAKERRDLDRADQRLIEARAAVAAANPSERCVNITDPESRIMKTAKGWLQGYNAQAAVNDLQIVVAWGVTQDANDVGQYQLMVTATQAALAAAGVTSPIETVLADAGYWSEDNATAEGPPRLIATVKDWKQRRAAREMGTTTGPPPVGASAIEAMEHRLRTPEGTEAYAQRSHTVEPFFGDIKENSGWRRFRRRGLSAAQSEWALMSLSHNVAKLYGHRASIGQLLT